MTTYNWSALTNGQSIAFNPATDILHFDGTETAGLGPNAAQQFDFFADPGPVSVFSFGGKEVTLNVDPRRLASSNVTFASGSLFKYGGNTDATNNDDSANTVNGGAQGDWLVGAGGNDTLNGGGGNDMLVVIGSGQLGTGAYGNDRLNGGAGIDQVFYDGATTAINANLATGVATGGRTGASTMTLISIENIVAGSGNDTLTGNGAANRLYGQEGNDSLVGNAGNDTLVGDSGNDTLAGGSGNDHYYIDSLSDVLTEAANAGTDKVFSLVSKTISINFENLTLLGSANLTGTGNSRANVLIGNTGKNVLNGGGGDDELLGLGGNDTLNGGDGNDLLLGLSGSDVLNGGNGNDTLDGGAGIDSMTGGAGDDTYHVIEEGDVAVEAANGGIDTIITNRSITMASHVERLVWLDTGDISGECIGNDLDNVMSVQSGPDGPGSLTMRGEGGIDTLSFAGHAEARNINLGAGNATFVNAIFGIENAEGGSGDDTLSGDDGDNVLIGNAGADTMRGEDGNDTFYVDDVGDVVIEDNNDLPGALLLPGTGTGPFGPGLAGIDGITDTVVAAINFSLAGLEFVENITLTGTATLATGNSLANELTGGAGNDSLSGAGGNDTLLGGNGNDTLNGGSGADSLNGGAGNDRLIWGAGDVVVDGGGGTDMLKLAGGNLNLKSLDNSVIRNIEQIDLRGGGANTLTVGKADVLAISSSTDTLRVFGEAVDTVNATGFILGGTAPVGFVRYANGTAVLLVDSDITVNT